MESLCLLVAHLVGDYIFQNDWQAQNKTTRSWPCLVHCTLYTLSVAIFCWWFLPVWVMIAVGVLHFPVDRWRLARKWMGLVGQESFATGPLAPWSIIVVDNTIHLLVLLAAGLASNGVLKGVTQWHQ